MKQVNLGGAARRFLLSLFVLVIIIPLSLRPSGLAAESPAAASDEKAGPLDGEGRTSVPGSVVARVGTVEITEADLQEAVGKKVMNLYSHNQDLAQKTEYRREALNELIEIELLFHEAGNRGIKIPDEVIDRIVEHNKKSLGSEEALQETLETRGLTMETFRNRIRKYRMVNELLLVLFRESAYSEDELRTYYVEHKESFRRPDSIHLYAILLKVDASAPEDEWQKRREKAEELLGKINAGEKFYDIAYYNSDDPYRVKGGDLGFIHKGMLTPPELEDAAFALKPDEVSGVIRTIHGFHILKAGERRTGELLEFEAVKDSLATRLQKKRFDEKKGLLLQRMRDTYPVQVTIDIGDEP